MTLTLEREEEPEYLKCRRCKSLEKPIAWKQQEYWPGVACPRCGYQDAEPIYKLKE